MSNYRKWDQGWIVNDVDPVSAAGFLFPVMQRLRIVRLRGHGSKELFQIRDPKRRAPWHGIELKVFPGEEITSRLVRQSIPGYVPLKRWCTSPTTRNRHDHRQVCRTLTGIRGCEYLWGTFRHQGVSEHVFIWSGKDLTYDGSFTDRVPLLVVVVVPLGVTVDELAALLAVSLHQGGIAHGEPQ